MGKFSEFNFYTKKALFKLTFDSVNVGVFVKLISAFLKVFCWISVLVFVIDNDCLNVRNSLKFTNCELEK